MTELDVRDIEPMNRHPKIHDAFEALEPGETLTIVNDHEPLFYEFQSEVETFDADTSSVASA